MRIRSVLTLICTASLALFAQPLLAQPDAPPDPSKTEGIDAKDANLNVKVGEDGARIVLEATGVSRKVPVFYRADVSETIYIHQTNVSTDIRIKVKVVQGTPKVLSFGLFGEGEIKGVEGAGLKAWSVRNVTGKRFLDLSLPEGKDQPKEFDFVVRARIDDLKVPSTQDMLHLQPGEAVGFTSVITAHLPVGLSVKLAAADGFLPLESENDNQKRFEGSLGKRLAFSFSRSDAISAPVEFINTTLEGTIDEEGNSSTFLLKGTAEVSKEDAVWEVLRGRAAISEVPAGAGYRLELVSDPSGQPVYQLRFAKPGSFPVELKIVARTTQADEWKSLSFQVRSGAIVPVVLRGIAAETEYHQNASVIPTREGDAWRGFLPLHGKVDTTWKTIREAGEGKLFFTTDARVNVGVGAGLMRQTSIVEYKILQGELKNLSINLEGPGEVLDVDGQNVLRWDVVEEGGNRRLDVLLSQPIEETGGLRIRSQLALGAFPVRAKPLRLVPVGSFRHSGYIRVYNIGATKLEVAGVTGLTQLSPEQFPVQGLSGGDRQTFVYRFPAADHDYEVVADRVTPVVSVSQLTVYELSESDRTILADLTLDIKHAPLREWTVVIPADYQVISVTTDYLVGTTVENNERQVTLNFGGEVQGTQLVKLHLEKNEAATDTTSWVLPKVRCPDADSMRGELGVASAPGFRLSTEDSSKLTEIPLSRFQKGRPDLQQTFRIRERDWAATMTVERLPQSVRADVFHLWALKGRQAYVSVVINYFITGAPVSEFRVGLPAELKDGGKGGNLSVIGTDIRSHQVVGDDELELVVPLHQPVIGPQTLLITYEVALDANATINPGKVEPKGVRGERGFIQVVSPEQVDVPKLETDLVKLNPLELPAEYQLFSSAPPLATYQYSSRPIEFDMTVKWFDAGATVSQVVEFVKASTLVSREGDVVTDSVLMVKTRGKQNLKAELPAGAELWEVEVNSNPVSARRGENENIYLIPMPRGADANRPVRVELRVGQEASGPETQAELALPVIHEAPILKAKWHIEGESGRVLVPHNGNLPIGEPVLKESGLEWIANRALGGAIAVLILIAFGVGLRFCCPNSLWPSLVGIVLLLSAFFVSIEIANNSQRFQRTVVTELDFTLPVIPSGEVTKLTVDNVTESRADLKIWGLGVAAVGILLLAWSFFAAAQQQPFIRLGGGVCLAVGLLAQAGGAYAFFVAVAIVIALILVPWIFRWSKRANDAYHDWSKRMEAERAAQLKEQEEAAAKAAAADDGDSNGPGPVGAATSLVLLSFVLLLGGTSDVVAKDAAPSAIPKGTLAADRLTQQWDIKEGRLKATAEVRVTGEPGDSYLLLKAPAVLTNFTSERLRVSKREVAGVGAAYVVSIRQPIGDPNAAQGPEALSGTFNFEMQVGKNPRNIAVPTGVASVQQVALSIDQSGWEFDSSAAMQVSDPEGLPEGASGAKLLLAPLATAQIGLSPKARDLKAEKTTFFTEVENLFLPSPGVIDAVHRLRVRPAQGQVSELEVTIPEGFTVGEVTGPVGQWQFDAEARNLKVVVEPAQAQPFQLVVETQSSLAPLPADATLAPASVTGSSGEVGTLALAFGSEAQPENATPTTLSAVNLTDFDQSLIPERTAAGGGKVRPALNRVYRYGAAGGSLALRVAPVAPEVRVSSVQVLSIGDEGIVLSVKFQAAITRAGLFKLSFPLPAGLEVESLSGAALSNWSEITEGDQRVVILNLNGKTIGNQAFNLTLTGPVPAPTTEEAGWTVPKFELTESQRHTGSLVIKPTTGVRLEPRNVLNVSDVDPRKVGGQGEGALAFRILQKTWAVELGISKDPPWISGSTLHELTLREGQTRHVIMGALNVQNASVRSIQVRLPGLDEDDKKSLRASGASVSDLVAVPDDPNLWTLQFKRRIIGDAKFRIQWERTGERPEKLEQLNPVTFPGLDKSVYYYALRAAPRLELTAKPDDPNTGKLPGGWQALDWNAVPKILRDSGNRAIPALTFKVIPSNNKVLGVKVSPHEVASALALRVAKGQLVTVVSPVGEQLTTVVLDVEVIQRGQLTVTPPAEAELYNVFVNGESVNIVQREEGYQFFVLPGSDGRTAQVRFVYATPRGPLDELKLLSPKLNVPLEKIDWRVVVPKEFDLVKHDGSLDYRETTFGDEVDLEKYLELAQATRDEQKRFGEFSIEQAVQAYEDGDQTRAHALFNSAANNYALDAATNEDARVRLTKLQEEQVFIGLNSRRQRNYLENAEDDPGFQKNVQLQEAAIHNPILNKGDLSYLPKEIGQFMEGNTERDNSELRNLAQHLVHHQRSNEPAPQAINITMPEEGRIFTFSRSVQVEDDAPMELELKFASPSIRSTSKEAFVLLLVAGICFALVLGAKRKARAA